VVTDSLQVGYQSCICSGKSSAETSLAG